MFPFRTLTVVLAASLASGCSMIPEYQRPAAPVAASFPNAAPAAAEATPADAIAWRDYFADARLREVIALALANNRDLRVAALNIEQARAQYRIQRADLFPAVGATGSQNAAAPAGESDQQRRGRGQPPVQRHHRFLRLRAGFLRPHPQPQRPGARASTSAPRKPVAARRSAWWPKSPTPG